MRITEQKFDEMMEDINKVILEEDGYIPSEDDILDYIEKKPEKYYQYLLWYSEHKPKPKTEEEKQRLKRINAIINRTVEIV